MGERTWGRKYRETVVCIDAYDSGVPSGTIYNPYLCEPKPFHGVTQFLKETDRMLNDMRSTRLISMPLLPRPPRKPPQHPQRKPDRMKSPPRPPGRTSTKQPQS